MTRWRFLPIALLALLASGATTHGQDDLEPSWMAPLKKQLMKEQNCNLLYATAMHELPLARRIVLTGRAHCDDGRAFDVERKNVDEPFTISACQPVAC